MNIQPFDTSAIQHNSLWFLLKNHYEEQVTLVRPTAVGPEPFTDFNAYRMMDGSVLLGFPNAMKTVFSQGYLAIGDGTTEFVSTQSYERVEHLVTLQPPNELGTFVFTDSQPVPPSLGWRCDVAYYGPTPFEDLEGNRVNPTEDVAVLVEFEPIISLPGHSHLVYLRRKDYAEGRYQHLNNALTPYTTSTLGECVKLIHEWSLVAQEPFNNDESIAASARHFCDTLGISKDLVEPYPDMQIVRFLFGHENARQQPQNIVGPTDSLIEFVKKNMSHMSLASLLSMTGGLWDISEVAIAEQPGVEMGKIRFFEDLTKTKYPNSGVVPQDFLATFVGTVVSSWFGHFDKAKELSKALMQ